MTDELKNGNNLPAVVEDGFDAAASDNNKLNRGVIIRCVEGKWTDTDGSSISSELPLIAWAITEALQRWQDKLPVEVIVKRPGVPLPDVDDLNAKIPQMEWEKGIDDNPRPPWVKQHVVYLLDARDGSEFTFVSGTVGAAIAVERLKDKTKNVRMLRGTSVVPVVALGNKLMATKFGPKLRPEFVIQEWRQLGAPQVPAQPVAAIEHVGSKVEEPSLGEELSDELPF